jgi:putative flippase GtrA
MIDKIKQLFLRYRELILYVIFGGLTTVVDWGVSFALYYVWGDAIERVSYLVHGVNVIAWAAAVAFAFVTNRILVFQSKSRGALAILRELVFFAGGRVMTLLLQELIFLVCFDFLHWNEYAVKLAAAVLVVVLNYFISKLLVFRRKNTSEK